jgi:LacI family transcriptional regulator
LGLARGRSHTVAILIPSLTWPWMGEVMQDVSDVVESEGYALLLFTCNHGAESMRQFTTHLSADSFDGLLAIEPEGTLSYIAELHARGLPVVLIDDRGHEPPFPSVGTTNRAGARAAADHLLGLGRRRPLIITGAQRFGCVRDRRSGFADGYAGAGWPLDPQLELEGDFTYQSGRTSAARAVREGLVFDAVFAHNGVMAAAAMGVLQEAGRRVPEDVAVVGFDDLPLTSHSPLSRPPLRQQGRRWQPLAVFSQLRKQAR